MLTSKITKAVFDTLPALLQAEYAPDATKPEDFLLQTDDLKELRNAKVREVQLRQETEAKLAAAITEREQAKMTLTAFQLANPDKATAEIEKQKAIDAALVSERTKTTAAEKKLEATTGRLQKTLLDHTVGSVINGLTDPDVAHLLEAPVAKRIKIDVTGDEPKIVFLDDSGQPTADTLQSFRKSIEEDKRYAKVVLGSKGTGGGAAGGSGQGGSGAGETKKFSDMNENDRRILLQTNPHEFARLSEAAKQATVATVYNRTQLIR